MRTGHIYRTWIDARYLIVDTSNEYHFDGVQNLAIGFSFAKRSIGLELIISRFAVVIYVGYIERVYGGIKNESRHQIGRAHV